MSAQLGVALIGAGGIGDVRAEAIGKTNGLALRVVADTRADAAGALAVRHQCDATSDWQSAVRRPDVEVVIVSTPPSSHAPISMLASESGKHVVCEKPLASNLQDAEQMCVAAERKGVLLKTGFNHRYFTAMAWAKRLIGSGAIGEVISVRAYAGHPGGVEFGHDWVHDGAVTGGGCLVDNGIHILDLTRFFFGEVATGKGYVSNLIWPFRDAEDTAMALFRSAEGRVAFVHASWTEWRGYRFWVEALCSRGYVRASYPPMLAEWGATPQPGIRAKRRLKVFPAFQVRERLRSWRWTIVRSFVEELSAFAAGIRDGREVPATGRDGLRAMRMAHAIYRSSREGIEVPV